jgi:phospholipid/cholesterol/gamma-HCH transport system ATP-binding protein
MTDSDCVVRFEGVKKSFGSTTVLDALDFRVERGENVAILGTSGTGKSVLLKLIIGLLRPDEGEIFLWGQPTSSLSEREMEPLRRRMGMVFQSGALFDSVSVFDNLAFPLREFGGVTEERIAEIVVERLEWVGLTGTAEQQPSELSGGMRKRVALARTLTVDPELILYDEPTTGLDPLNGRRVSTLIQNLDRKLESTSIVVTHDLACARTVASRWCYLSGGSVLVDGSPSEVLASRSDEVREFLADFQFARGPVEPAQGRESS